MIDIAPDDPSNPDVAALLRAHLADMAAVSPPDSCHALKPEALRAPEVTFWTARNGTGVAGCAALVELDPTHGEIKSMRTARRYQEQGIASELLQHIVAEAKARGYTRLSLETGAQPYFEPARKLYAKYGFVPCEPFPPYRPDPNSVFMTREL